MDKFTIVDGEDDGSQVEEKIKKHNFRKRLIITFIVLIAIAAIVAGVLYKIYKQYDDYVVLNTIDKESKISCQCVKYGDGFLKYDSDGITYYDSDNKVVWQQSYEITTPSVSVCGDYVAVAGIGSSSVYLLDKEGLVKTVDTNLKITEIEVTAVGAFVVCLEDQEINYIRMFDAKGNIIYDLKKVIEGEGYPLDVAVSEDGTKLVVSCLFLDNLMPKGKLMCYNFSEVGKNEVDYYVGGYEYDEIMPVVRFMDNDSFIAVGERMICRYDMDEYPELVVKEQTDYDIERLFINNGYVATVDKTDKAESPYRLVVYNSKLKSILHYEYDKDYTDMIFMKDDVMLYNSETARIIDYHGIIHFEYDFHIPIRDIVWISGKDRFVFVNAKSIQQIRLD